MWLRYAAATALVLLGVAARAEVAIAWWWLPRNVLLAWIPIVLGAAAARDRRALAPLLPIWLVFLPNAPYLVTDLVHLQARRGVPFWFDAALLGGAGALGLAMGAASVWEVAGAVSRAWGRAAGVALAVAMVPLTGLALHLGRYARWNSWDVPFEAGAVLAGLAPIFTAPRSHAEDWAYIATHAAVFGAAVALSYRRDAVAGNEAMMRLGAGRSAIVAVVPRALLTPQEKSSSFPVEPGGRSSRAASTAWR